jgi:hypothetical protein
MVHEMGHLLELQRARCHGRHKLAFVALVFDECLALRP